MAWIEPLDLETWVINVFSGNNTIFAVIALLVIAGMAGYFRMNGISMITMIAIFVLMFAGYIPAGITTFLLIIGGLIIGYWISRLVK